MSNPGISLSIPASNGDGLSATIIPRPRANSMIREVLDRDRLP